MVSARKNEPGYRLKQNIKTYCRVVSSSLSYIGIDEIVKIEVNLECAIIATKKRSDCLQTGGGAPPNGLTLAEDLALALNRALRLAPRPSVSHWRSGNNSKVGYCCRMLSLPTVNQLALFQLYDFLVVVDGDIKLVDPPQEDVLHQEE